MKTRGLGVVFVLAYLCFLGDRHFGIGNESAGSLVCSIDRMYGEKEVVGGRGVKKSGARNVEVPSFSPAFILAPYFSGSPVVVLIFRFWDKTTYMYTFIFFVLHVPSPIFVISLCLRTDIMLPLMASS